MSKQEKTWDTLSPDALKKLVSSIKTRAASVQSDITMAALASAKQVEVHRNTTPLNDLWRVMPEGIRKNALGLWFVKYAGVKLAEGKAAKVNRFTLDDAKAVRLEAGLAEPWFKIKTEKALDALVDVQSEVDRLLKRLDKAVKAGKVDDQGKGILDSVRGAVAASRASQADAELPPNGMVLPGDMAARIHAVAAAVQ